MDENMLAVLLQTGIKPKSCLPQYWNVENRPKIRLPQYWNVENRPKIRLPQYWNVKKRTKIRLPQYWNVEKRPKSCSQLEVERMKQTKIMQST
jgi:hypothetical protein